MTGAGVPRLAVRGLHKAFAVPVLVDVNLDVRAGEVHALLGANGAGKSTLTRIVCGLTRPDRGDMTLDGHPHAPASRRDAERAGVQLVLQELDLIPTLSVAESLCLGDLPRRFGVIDRRRLDARARSALATVGLDYLDPWAAVGRLGIGHQQLVAIAAALARPCRLLVLDEPTAALSGPETRHLMARLRVLRDNGVAVLFISHRLDEVAALVDRATVLRDGRVVATLDAGQFDRAHVVRLMTDVGGAAASKPAPADDRAARVPGPDRRRVALRVEGLSRGRAVRGVSFDVHQGEVLGLAGLVGAGRTETLRAIVGADRPDEGRVSRGDGSVLRIDGPHDAVRAGIGMVPEDRRAHGLLASRPVRDNLTLGVLPRLSRWRTWIDADGERARAQALVEALDIRCVSLDQPVQQLSGGNQQKVVMGRWLLRGCDVLLLDEPTRGMDVSAREAMHRLLRDLAARGTALVVASSELTELMAICDRIVVLSGGRVTGTFTRGAWDEAALTAAAFEGLGGAA